jgi:agmatinase
MHPERIESPGTVAVLGVPLDRNVSFLQGPALAPARIRATLRDTSSTMWTERGIDLASHGGWIDVGDVAGVNEAPDYPERIEGAVAELLSRDARVVALGGDHSITYPLLKATAARHPGLTVLHIDAHPDLYDDYEGNPYSHASPFARVMEQELVSRLVQVGIRTLNDHQRAQAERFGVEVIEMRDWSLDRLPALEPPLYLSLDLDGLDPAFAPGVSHHEPGGFTTRQVLDILHRLPPLIGADIVELNPHRDPSGITVALAAKLLKEIVANMLGGLALGGAYA